VMKKVDKEHRRTAWGLSLSPKDRECIEKVRKQYGFVSKSEAVRFCIRMAASGRIVMPDASLSEDRPDLSKKPDKKMSLGLS